MSEYVTIEVEYGDDQNVVELYVNQTLTELDVERYLNPNEGDLGSPIAQLLFAAVDGIERLTIESDRLTITRAPNQPWEAIIDETRDALRDWYL